MTEKLLGYKGKVLYFLKEVEAEVGDTIRVSKGKGTYEGVLIPRSEFSDGNHVVIKLKNGYNIGILVTQETKIERVGAGQKPTFSTSPLPKQQEELPEVTILSTGGTIASRVDYRTGGVRPALNANDLYSIVPELSEIATIKAEILYTVFSENITPKHWIKLAKEVAKNIKEGIAGIVVAHGTDTIGYTAAALSFALQNIPVPIVLVGSQRSADRPSSDAATNLIGAVTVAAKAPFAEVVVAMHRTTSDKAISLHRGTKVRKCHTSRRDAFKSINTLPLAILEDGKLRMLTQDYQRRNPKREVIAKPSFNEKVALVKFHPGLNRGVIDWYLDQGYEGIVLEGTGLGHVSSQCFATLRRAIAENCLVAMTSQCIWGRVNMNVYDTGRDLIKIGVIPLGDMLSETALVKIMWVLAQTKSVDEAKKLLAKNVTHEVSDRTVYQDCGR